MIGYHEILMLRIRFPQGLPEELHYGLPYYDEIGIMRALVDQMMECDIIIDGALPFSRMGYSGIYVLPDRPYILTGCLLESQQRCRSLDGSSELQQRKM